VNDLGTVSTPGLSRQWRQETKVELRGICIANKSPENDASPTIKAMSDKTNTRFPRMMPVNATWESRPFCSLILLIVHVHPSQTQSNGNTAPEL
jgi:hypothetical protein